MIVALRTGMRRGGILSVRWTDICDGAIHLRPEVCKSGRGRSIPTDPVVTATLRHLSTQAPGEQIFPISGETVRILWDRACKRADLMGGRFHDT